MDLTPIIALVVLFSVVPVWLLIVSRSKQFRGDNRAHDTRDISIIYMRKDKKISRYNVKLTKAYELEDAHGDQHLVFDGTDSSGIERTFAAEHVLEAQNDAGRPLLHFANFLRRNIARDGLERMTKPLYHL